MRRNDTDQRRYLRYEVLEFAAATLETTGEQFRSVVTDIGLGGLQLRTRVMVEAGSHVHLRIGRLSRGVLDLNGEVRHCDVVEGSDLFSVGIRFTPKNHDERITIAEYVHDVFQRQCDLLSQ